MPNVLIQPCGAPAQQHFDKTIKHPVSTKVILDGVDAGKRAELEPLLKGRATVPTWGVGLNRQPQVRAAWRDLRPGDLAAFCGLKKVLATGPVIAMLTSAEN